MATEPAPDREQRRRRLAGARLYLVSPCEVGPQRWALGELLPGLFDAGVDIVQLRDKDADDERLVAVAREAAAAARAAGALLLVNDRPELALADGVHVGQDDLPVAHARRIVGEDLLVGLSTHTPGQVDGGAESGVDYIGVGPVHATPTKPGRTAVGLELVAYAARRATCPWFAIGGIDAANVGAVLGAGARRVAVVRAIAAAPDPVGAARALRAALDGAPSGVDPPETETQSDGSPTRGTPAEPATHA
jgi:thiamine-phosphate pyrophosphorylase